MYRYCDNRRDTCSTLSDFESHFSKNPLKYQTNELDPYKWYSFIALHISNTSIPEIQHVWYMRESKLTQRGVDAVKRFN